MSRLVRWRTGLLTFVLICVACGPSNPIIGSPTVGSTSVSVSAFSILQVSDAFDVDLTLGSKESLTLHLNENLVDRVDAGVTNGKLHIGLKPGVEAKNATLRAEVTAVSLSDIELSGAAHVHLQNEFSGQGLGLSISGAGGFDGTMRAETVNADLSGASEVILAGTLRILTVRASGASQLNGGQLHVADLTVDLSGASIAVVMVTDTISAQLSGASTLQYGGTRSYRSQIGRAHV